MLEVHVLVKFETRQSFEKKEVQHDISFVLAVMIPRICCGSKVGVGVVDNEESVGRERVR